MKKTKVNKTVGKVKALKKKEAKELKGGSLSLGLKQDNNPAGNCTYGYGTPSSSDEL